MTDSVSHRSERLGTPRRGPNTCPECGSNTYFAANFDRVRDKAAAIEQAMKRAAAQHAIERSTWDIEKMDRANDNAWLQRKVDAQAKALKRLEQRIRALGVHPYDDVTLPEMMLWSEGERGRVEAENDLLRDALVSVAGDHDKDELVLVRCDDGSLVWAIEPMAGDRVLVDGRAHNTHYSAPGEDV